jgi:hypothetical protein
MRYLDVRIPDASTESLVPDCFMRRRQHPTPPVMAPRNLLQPEAESAVR